MSSERSCNEDTSSFSSAQEEARPMGTMSEDEDGAVDDVVLADECDSPCFFADATLDLTEAHGMAETPELSSSSVHRSSRQEIEFKLLHPSSSGSNGFDKTLKSSSDETMTSVPFLISGNHPIVHSVTTGTTRPSYRPRPPRRPRDVPWALAALILVPASFVLPFYTNKSTSNSENSTMIITATATATIAAYLSTLLWNRLFYITTGGGDGEDTRYQATRFILWNVTSLFIHPLFLLFFFTQLKNVTWMWSLPPMWGMCQEWIVFSQHKGKRIFFQELACTALDILSRTFKRSFSRVVTVTLFVQLLIILLWRWSLSKATNFTVLCLLLLGGKWATGIVTRVLALIASGGVTAWFAQQTILMEERIKTTTGSGSDTTSEDEGYELSTGGDLAGRAAARAALHSMPEAYRSADASAYRPVMDFEEGVDDDFDDDDFDDENKWTGGSSPPTVKLFLFQALTTSLGSVAQCGLLGGFAQFVWSTLRNIDSVWRFGSNRDFRGMSIGGTIRDVIIWNKMNALARQFVRNHSDLAMSQVAAYFKSYQRAANDVLDLIDSSGVELIVHDDISTHMCSSVCTALSGIIVLVMGCVLMEHNNNNKDDDEPSDVAICKTMLTSFIMCYTMIFTVTEPLRASIKAVYVCFAQHPQSLSQAFPLIFHRLSRMSESNLI